MCKILKHESVTNVIKLHDTWIMTSVYLPACFVSILTQLQATCIDLA